MTAMVVVLGAALHGNMCSAASTLSRTSSFDYDLSTGMLVKVAVEPLDSKLCAVTVYELDAYGHRKTTTVRNCNGSPAATPGSSTEAAAPGGPAVFAARTSSNTFSADQRFTASTSNALGQVESRTYDGRFGLPTSVTDVANALTTSWAYDGFGRKVLEKRPDGNGTRWDYRYCSGVNGGSEVCPVIGGISASSVITTTPVSGPVDLAALTNGSPNGPYRKIYYDDLGRELRSEMQGADVSGASQLIYQDTEYNDIGQVARKSRPYYSGARVYWTSYYYDALERVTSTTETVAGGTAVSFTAYNGLSTTTYDALNHATVHTRNAAGWLATVTDHLGNSLTNAYDPTGNLVQVVDANGNVLSMVYDTLGRKTAMYDPDMGVWGYCYDALGQIKAQQSPNGRGSNTLAQCPTVSDSGSSATPVSGWTTMAYDKLGRMTARSEATLNSRWYYDSYADGSACSKGAGKLCESSAGNGYGKKYVYDALGRLSAASSMVGAAFTATTSYDANGHVDVQTYPSGLRVQNSYSPLGFLKQVKELRTGSALWTAGSYDAQFLPLQYTYGNGVVSNFDYYPDGRLNTTRAGPNGAVQTLSHSYDLAGNLASRMDLLTNVTAYYTHDALNRLTVETRSGGGLSGAQVMQWNYNAIGNLSSRVEGGSTHTYSYPSSGAGSSRPHAVVDVSGLVNGYAPPYQYDANGNFSSGAGRSVSWTSFDKVQTIANASAKLDYLYDVDHERAKESYYRNGALQRTTVYLNPAAGAGLYYEEESGPAGLKKKHYITASNQVVAVIVYDGSAWRTQYWHTDHIGSVSTVTGEAGTVLERLAYEPFGKRRYANGINDATGTLAPVTTDRGYTQHEHLDEVGLINMNGRVYDPSLSRFMSADPTIPWPTNLQSYNRYTYVQNNPLTLTDPSGYEDGDGGAAGSGASAGDAGDSFSSNPGQWFASNPGHAERNDATCNLRDWGLNSTQVMGDFTQSGSTKIAGAAASPPPMAARGAEIRQINRLWDKAVAAGNVPAMQEAFARYASNAGEGPSSAMQLVAWGSVLLRARADAGLGTDDATLSIMAAAGLTMGMAGNGPAAKGTEGVAYVVTPSGVAIPTKAAELKSNLRVLTEASTNPASSRKFVGTDSQGPLRVRIEKGHPADPNFAGKPDPLHTVDHLHIDRRANGTSGPWSSTEKASYGWPF